MGETIRNRTEEDLASAARQGDMDAFEELVSRFQPRLHRFLCQLTRNSEDAQELTQDAFVRTYGGLQAYDPARPFAPWLFTIARRLATDRARRSVIAGSGAERLSAQSPEPVDPTDPSANLERNDSAKALWDLARAILKPAQFQALWLHYVEDLDVAGVACVMGLTRVHVKVLLFRGRKALAKAKQNVLERTKPKPTPDASPLLRSSAVGESS